MDSKIVVALIETIPSILWAAVVTALFYIFRKEISEKLIPRLSEIEAFGVKAKLIKNELERAAQELPKGAVQNSEQVVKRAERLSSTIQGALILLVNDVPSQMCHVINILKSSGAIVDVETSTESALAAMKHALYDVVISDMKRGNIEDEGQRILNETVKNGIHRPTIFTVGHFQPERGVPPHSSVTEGSRLTGAMASLKVTTWEVFTKAVALLGIAKPQMRVVNKQHREFT